MSFSRIIFQSNLSLLTGRPISRLFSTALITKLDCACFSFALTFCVTIYTNDSNNNNKLGTYTFFLNNIILQIRAPNDNSRSWFMTRRNNYHVCEFDVWKNVDKLVNRTEQNHEKMFDSGGGGRSLDPGPGEAWRGFQTFVDGVFLHLLSNNFLRDAFQYLHIHSRGER